MKIQVILHASFEPTGVIQNWASNNGHELIEAHPYRGEKMLEPDQFDALLIMGGPQSPLELHKSPYLKDEIECIAQTIKASKKVLGFCLGAQLIGEALGARAEKSPFKEIGMWPIELTNAGQKDRLFKRFPSMFNVLQWHNDMPGVPHGAEILASSPGCPRQIIRFKDHVYGFQCHPEMTLSVIRRLAEHCAADLDGGHFVQSRDVLLQHDLTDMHEKAFCLLDRFFQ
jgi:GMP synthase (glutamine-hydrolysing)